MSAPATRRSAVKVVPNLKFFSIGNVVCLVVLIMTVGCTTSGGLAADFASSPAYQAREEIQESLFASDQNVLSNEAIEKILGGKVVLPVEVNLAVLPLGSKTDVDATDELFDALLDSPRVAHAS